MSLTARRRGRRAGASRHRSSLTGSTISSGSRLPHPRMSALALTREERRLRRVSKDEKRIVASWFETAQAPPHHEDGPRALPLFPERADFQLKGPGAARLLVKLPVRG